MAAERIVVLRNSGTKSNTCVKSDRHWQPIQKIEEFVLRIAIPFPSPDQRPRAKEDLCLMQTSSKHASRQIAPWLYQMYRHYCYVGL